VACWIRHSSGALPLQHSFPAYRTHNPLSIFKGYDEFRKVNPLVKVPTLVCDDGQMLVHSTLIIDYLESSCVNGKSLVVHTIWGLKS